MTLPTRQETPLTRHYPLVAQAIQEAIDLAGGQRELAEALGVSKQAVNQWVAGHRWVPVARARHIESLYGVPAASLVNPEKVLG